MNNEILQPQSKCVHSFGVIGKPFTEGLNLFTMDEIWKDVPEFEGVYQISNLGRLRTLAREFIDKRGFLWKVKARMRSVKNKNGWYLTVSLSNGVHSKTARIHRLVAESFIPNPENKPEVNHKDLNKQNNVYTNLEWATTRENNLHAGLHKPWKNYGMIKYNTEIRPIPIIQFSLNGQFIAEYKNGHDASVATGVCQRNILQVANETQYKPGKIRHQAGGFIWKLKPKINDIKNTRKFVERQLVLAL